MIRGRQDLASARRVVIKAGTSVVSTPDGYPSLSRMADIVEHAAHLVREGKEVLIVTSGAVGVGRQRLRRQALLRQSMSDLISQKSPALHNGGSSSSHNLSEIPLDMDKVSYNSACAAAGQLGLMSLYETMFNQFDITTSQLLVTAFDFASVERRKNIKHVISQLLALGIVPLLNENDCVSANQGYQLFGNSFSDNDSLASLVAIEVNAQLLILLTDVKGVYDRPPTDPESKLIDIFNCEKTTFKVLFLKEIKLLTCFKSNLSSRFPVIAAF
jgi:delta-1-pyrroline-5-carboxylate synthetase